MKRQSKFLLQPDWLFSLSSYKYDLMKQLGIIHGFTNQVRKILIHLICKSISIKLITIFL